MNSKTQQFDAGDVVVRQRDIDLDAMQELVRRSGLRYALEMLSAACKIEADRIRARGKSVRDPFVADAWNQESANLDNVIGALPSLWGMVWPTKK